jgi:uncharacterized protein YcbK (DUF882 family)
VSGITGRNLRGWALRALLSAALVFAFAPWASAPVTAGQNDRTLCLRHTHTVQEGCFTFKKNGVYDQAALRQMNVFLADWRTKDVTKMDPALFDLIWTIYQEVRGRNPVNIVSSYRTPKTNAMLRARSSAVAENSQHMLGKAMDIFIPGVDLYTLRAAAMRHQFGGVGYYPTSGSPFVHVDTGSVRAWPRMTTAQLKKVFPDGKTLHLPLDGRPISDKGRAYAQAQWNKCHMVPCTGAPAIEAGLPEIVVASLDAPQRTVSTVGVNAIFPAKRPAFLDEVDAPAPRVAPVPARMSDALRLATRGSLTGEVAATALDAFDALEQGAGTPKPRDLMSPDEDVLTAYAPEMVPDEGARRALEILIARETTAATPKPEPTVASLDPAEIRTGAGGTNGLDVFNKMFDLTWTAVTSAGARPTIATALTGSNAIPQIEGLAGRKVQLIAPEIDHIYDMFGAPEPLSSIRYAELYEPEGYLDRAAELGPYASRIVLESNLVAPEPYNRFVRRAPELVATR